MEHHEVHRSNFEKNQSKNFKDSAKPRMRTMDRAYNLTFCSGGNVDIVAGPGEITISDG
jgi:hypothetical protein